MSLIDMQCELLVNMSKEDLDRLLLLASEQYHLNEAIIMEKLLKFEINMASVEGMPDYIDNQYMKVLANFHKIHDECRKQFNNMMTD